MPGPSRCRVCTTGRSQNFQVGEEVSIAFSYSNMRVIQKGKGCTLTSNAGSRRAWPFLGLGRPTKQKTFSGKATARNALHFCGRALHTESTSFLQEFRESGQSRPSSSLIYRILRNFVGPDSYTFLAGSYRDIGCDCGI